MRILLLIFFALLACQLTAQSTETRQDRNTLQTAAKSPAKLFELRLERLKTAIRDNDPANMIALQSELLLGIREAMETAAPERKAALSEALGAFEGFSFHAADAAERKRKTGVLERAAALIE